MRILTFTFFILCSAAFAVEGYAIDYPVEPPGTDYYLQYDDGSASWIFGGYGYYATWFDVEDFIPGGCNFDCEYSEWWFYHQPMNPWDTDQIVVELWEGDVSGPVTQLTSDTIYATHLYSSIVYYTPSVLTSPQFWLCANTQIFSANGLPAVLYDGSENFTGSAHSFLQDGLSFIPATAGGVEVNAFFRANGEIANSFESESWAAIKGLFR
jgi:hypothetical protein